MDIPDYLKPQLEDLDHQIDDASKLLSDPELKLMAEDEIKKLEAQKQVLLQAAQPSQGRIDDNDITRTHGVIIEIRSAAGGEEAKIWATDLLRMYLRYIENKKWKFEMLSEMTIKVISKQAYELMQYESGVHRVQRIPVTEKNGRIHTSTATVAILPIIPPTRIELKSDDIKMDYFRSGGHGGQNVNKVNTGVRLTHIPTGLVVECTQTRTQFQNRELAEQMLRGKLWQIEEQKRLAEIDSKRADAVGRGMRAEKIRTYNYPQNRLTDHRINKTW